MKKLNYITKKCVSCKKKFSTDDPSRKYCSRLCYAERFAKRVGPKRKKCAECGKRFTANPAYVLTCSPECRKKRNKKHQYAKPRRLKTLRLAPEEQLERLKKYLEKHG